MNSKILRSIVFGMVVTSLLTFWGYKPAASAQTLKMPVSKEKIAMYYIDEIGRRMPDKTEKEAINIAENVTKQFFKALYDKQYRVAYNYFSTEIQNKVGYEAFANNYLNIVYTSLQYCNPIAFEGNLIILSGRYEQLIRTNDDKFDPRLYDFKIAINKIGNDWKIVDLTEEDVTLKYL